MDGFEVCQRLRARPDLAEIPVLMVTALDDRDSKLRGIEAGADDFLSKPFDRNELRVRIRTIAKLNRYRRLVAERSRFEWAINRSKDGFLLLNQQGEITYCNESASQFLGLESLQSLPIDFMQVTTNDYRLEPEDAWQDSWWQQHTADQPTRYLLRPETNNCAALWLQCHLYQVPDDDHCLLHLQNISEQMNLEQQMWNFQTSVSHKLRAPLNGLVSLQMLNQDILKNAERSEVLLKIARESAKRLQDQILEILQYIDSNRKNRHKQIFAFNQLDNLVHLISSESAINNAKVQLDPKLQDAHLNLSIETMELILRELLQNAEKFHPQQSPTIQVSANLHAENQAFAVIEVLDDGQHIANEDIQRVWSPYYQSEKSFTGEVKGMGLGLAMIARQILQHGGRYSLQNRTDQAGVCVCLEIPLSD